MKSLVSALRWVATGTVTVLMTACYGVMTGFDPEIRVMYGVPTSLRATVRAVNDQGIPLPAIRVSYATTAQPGPETPWIEAGLTDAQGEATIDVDGAWFGDVSIRGQDTDGPENGAYRDTEALLETDPQDLVLDRDLE